MKAIITGASSGLGREFARCLSARGASLILTARREDRLEELKKELGGDVKTVVCDLSERDSVFALCDAVKDEDADILINNAGILPKFDKFQHYSIEDIEKAMNINFYSAVYSMHALLPLLLESPSPAIINIDSSAALMSLAGTSVYSASKAALKSLTESMREELRGKCYVGIVCPGFTKTDIFRNQGSSDEKAQKMLNMVSTSCDTMVKWIMNGIKKQHELMVFGMDAAFMNYFGRLLPVQGGRLFSAVMKMSKLPLFDGIFKED